MYDRIVKIRRTRYYLIETIAGLAILALINVVFFPDRPAFDGIQPNPYWIIVLAMAARYGRNGGLLASVLTSLVFVTHYLWFGGIEVFYDDLWLLRYPFFFILVGFLIGEVRTVFILREDYLTKRVEELQGMSERLQKEVDIVKEAHKDLTVDVATKQETITILNEITGRLKSLDPDAIFENILTCFRDFVDAEECSFYQTDGETLKLYKQFGWQEYYRRPNEYAFGHGLIGLAAKMLKPVSLKDIVLKRHKSEDLSGHMVGDTVLAIPVVGFENRVFGVASVEKIPLLKLTESTIQTGKVICDLAAAALNNAIAFLDIKAKQIKEDAHDIYKYHYFLSRSEEEFLRCMNYMIPLSAMAFRWPELERLPEEKRGAVTDSVITILKGRLRPFDVLARGPEEDMPLVLLLATTSGPQAEDVKKKIVEEIGQYDLGRFLAGGPLDKTITVASFNPKTMKSARDFLEAVGIKL